MTPETTNPDCQPIRPVSPVTAIPRPGDGKRGEDGHLAYLLRQAGVAVRARMDRALADLEVTPPQFAVLTMLAAYPGLSNADLARLSLLTPQTVSVIVGNLKKAGAVASRPHAVHGRIRQLEITDSGRATLALCKERVAAIETAMATGLSAEEDRTVRRWLVGIATMDA
ncbi:MAG: MarR family transcriptional regulator [Telmatospirillum sp.]|nr:MarR family transcriptional regulator [Telmatospirillum sp.]